MVQSTCRKCGAVHSHDDRGLPPSGLVVKCAKCGSPVHVLPPSATLSKTSAGVGGPSLKPGAQTTGEELELSDDDLFEIGADTEAGPLSASDLASMPAPSRPSPLAGVKAEPAPTRKTLLPDVPTVAPPGKPGARLPSIPVTPPGRPGAKPTAGRRPPGDFELPAPVGPTSSRAADLPAPVGPTSSRAADLPTPVGPASSRDVDLPAPVGPKSRRGADLPAPVGPSSSRDADLPTPVRPSSRRPADLPAPVGPASSRAADLPTPVGPASSRDVDLPVPVRPSSGRNIDLPVPVAPRPSSTQQGFGSAPPSTPDDFKDGLELSEPGFDFSIGGDDAAPVPPAEEEFSLDLGPSGAPGESERATRSGHGSPINDGLSARATVAGLGTEGLAPAPRPTPGPSSTTPGMGTAADADDFLDLGEPLGTSDAPADSFDLGEPLGAGDLDLGEPSGGDSFDLGEPLGEGGLDLSPSGADASLDLGGDDPLGLGGGSLEFDAPVSTPSALSKSELDLEPAGGGDDDDIKPFGLDDLDLAAPDGSSAGPGLAGGDRFGGVDLPSLDSAGDDGGDVVTFKAPSTSPSPGPSAPQSSYARRDLGDDAPLQLDTAPRPGAGVAGPASASVSPAASAVSSKAAAEVDKAAVKKKSKRRSQIIAAVALVVVAGGAAGYHFYTKWTDKKERQERVAHQLNTAASELISDTPGHWQRAIDAAEQATRTDKSNAQAFAVLAQGHYAAAVTTGTNVNAHNDAGRAAVDKSRSLKSRGADAFLAEGLQALAENRPGEALRLLRDAALDRPNDVMTQLGVGWGYAATGDHARAAEAFSAAIAIAPEHTHAHYGLGQAQLALGKTAEARESFQKTIKLSADKFHIDHLGAMVGVAELAEIDSYSDRETRYLEILKSKDVDASNPRWVSRAWSLAGDQALYTDRLAVAQERYDEALKKFDANLDALVGLSQVARRKKDFETARQKLDRVLNLSPQHVTGTLSLAEVLFDEGKATDNEDKIIEAGAPLDKLFSRNPPIENSAILTRMLLLRGRMLAGHSTTKQAAEDSFKEAIAKAAEGNIEPIVALASFYVAEGRGNDSRKLLDPEREKARKDPALALSLGITYVAVDDPATAIEFFRIAVKLRPDDIESRYQLGRALFHTGGHDEALAVLEKAFADSNKREDIGLSLAGYYEQLGRDNDAFKTYESILSAESPSLNARARAGRFFARKGDSDRAAQVGESLLAEDPENAAGHFLKGEASFSRGAFGEAKESFDEAIRLEPHPQYMEAAGRAAEQIKDLEEALKQFNRAIAEDGAFLAPRLGRARIFLLQRDYPQALEEYENAQEVLAKLPRTDEVLAAKPELYYGIGACQYELRNLDKAKETLRLAIKEKKEHAASHFMLGETYQQLSRTKEAAGEYALATKYAQGKEDWFLEAYYQLGSTARESGNNSQAKEAWEFYLDNAPDSPKRDQVKRILRGM